jgi:hypothetical protein
MVLEVGFRLKQHKCEQISGNYCNEFCHSKAAAKIELLVDKPAFTNATYDYLSTRDPIGRHIITLLAWRWVAKVFLCYMSIEATNTLTACSTYVCAVSYLRSFSVCSSWQPQ